MQVTGIKAIAGYEVGSLIDWISYSLRTLLKYIHVVGELLGLLLLLMVILASDICNMQSHVIFVFSISDLLDNSWLVMGHFLCGLKPLRGFAAVYDYSCYDTSCNSIGVGQL